MAKSGRGPTSISGPRNQVNAEIIVYIDGMQQLVPDVDTMRSAEYLAIGFYPENTVPP